MIASDAARHLRDEYEERGLAVPVTRRDALYTALGSEREEEEGTRRAQEKVSPMCQSGDLERIHLVNLGMELILGLEVETPSCSDCRHCKSIVLDRDHASSQQEEQEG